MTALEDLKRRILSMYDIPADIKYQILKDIEFHITKEKNEKIQIQQKQTDIRTDL